MAGTRSICWCRPTRWCRCADELTFTAGAAIACGSGTAYGALRRMNISGRDTIAIFGQGPVGLAGTQFAKAMGARVIALDINPQRLARAKEFGADEVVDPGVERSGRGDQGPDRRAVSPT